MAGFVWRRAGKSTSNEDTAWCKTIKSQYKRKAGQDIAQLEGDLVGNERSKAWDVGICSIAWHGCGARDCTPYHRPGWGGAHIAGTYPW